MTKEITDEVIMNRIYSIRGQKVMIDRDLTELYGVETKQLKRQVRRNMGRFPEDFMFILTAKEYESLRSQFGTLKKKSFRIRYCNLQYQKNKAGAA